MVRGTKTFEKIMLGYQNFFANASGAQKLFNFSKIPSALVPGIKITTPLLLIGYGLFDEICDKIRYIISKKSDITDSIIHNFRKIRICSFNTLFKILTFHSVIMFVRSVVNKNENEYYYDVILEKG